MLSSGTALSVTASPVHVVFLSNNPHMTRDYRGVCLWHECTGYFRAAHINKFHLKFQSKFKKKNCDAVYCTARGPEKLWATVRHICVRSVPAWYMPMGTTLQNVNR